MTDKTTLRDAVEWFMGACENGWIGEGDGNTSRTGYDKMKLIRDEIVKIRGAGEDIVFELPSYQRANKKISTADELAVALGEAAARYEKHKMYKLSKVLVYTMKAFAKAVQKL